MKNKQRVTTANNKFSLLEDLNTSADQYEVVAKKDKVDKNTANSPANSSINNECNRSAKEKHLPTKPIVKNSVENNKNSTKKETSKAVHSKTTSKPNSTQDDNQKESKDQNQQSKNENASIQDELNTSIINESKLKLLKSNWGLLKKTHSQTGTCPGHGWGDDTEGSSSNWSESLNKLNIW